MVSKLDMLSKGHLVFANGPEIWTPSIFGNRHRSRSALVNALSDAQAGTVVEIVDQIGSGKSFLVDTFYSELEMLWRARGRSNVPKLVVTPHNVKGGRAALQAMPGYEFIVFDEMDSKNMPGQAPYTLGLLNTMGLANTLLGSTFNALILVGDRALDNARLWACLPNCKIRIRIDMEPLDEAFFLLAMALRLKRYLPQIASAADPYELREVARGLFDVELLECLLPQTEISVATFRTVLWLAGRLAGELESSAAPCIISGDQVRSWFHQEPAWFDSDEQEEFARQLFRVIRDRRTPSTAFGSMSLEDLRDACSVAGFGDNQEFLEEIVIPLINANLLMAMGIPYEDGDTYLDRFSGPYLPTPLAFLHAAFDENVA